MGEWGRGARLGPPGSATQGLGQALDVQGGLRDAQLLPQSRQGLLPAPLIVQVEDTRGPAPILNCPRDQLRDQHLQVPVGQQREKKQKVLRPGTRCAQQSRCISQLIFTQTQDEGSYYRQVLNEEAEAQ